MAVRAARPRDLAPPSRCSNAGWRDHLDSHCECAHRCLISARPPSITRSNRWRRGRRVLHTSVRLDDRIDRLRRSRLRVACPRFVESTLLVPLDENVCDCDSIPVQPSRVPLRHRQLHAPADAERRTASGKLDADCLAAIRRAGEHQADDQEQHRHESGTERLVHRRGLHRLSRLLRPSTGTEVQSQVLPHRRLDAPVAIVARNEGKMPRLLRGTLLQRRARDGNANDDTR